MQQGTPTAAAATPTAEDALNLQTKALASRSLEANKRVKALMDAKKKELMMKMSTTWLEEEKQARAQRVSCGVSPRSSLLSPLHCCRAVSCCAASRRALLSPTLPSRIHRTLSCCTRRCPVARSPSSSADTTLSLHTVSCVRCVQGEPGGIMGGVAAMKAVTQRMHRELSAEAMRLRRLHGNVFDATGNARLLVLAILLRITVTVRDVTWATLVVSCSGRQDAERRVGADGGG